MGAFFGAISWTQPTRNFFLSQTPKIRGHLVRVFAPAWPVFPEVSVVTSFRTGRLLAIEPKRLVTPKEPSKRAPPIAAKASWMEPPTRSRLC